MNYMDIYKDRKATCINDYSLSVNCDSIISEILNNIHFDHLVEWISLYPHEPYNRIRSAIIKAYNIDNMLLCNGSDELIVLINRVFSANKKVGIVMPNFYRIYETCHDYIPFVLSYDLEDCYLDIQELFHILSVGDIETLWITNPNSIIGKAYTKRDLLLLVKTYKKVTFIVDESMVDFVDISEDITVIHHTLEYDNLIVIRSFSKFYGVPGIRCAFVVANPLFLNLLRKNITQFPISGLSAYIAAELLEKLDARHIKYSISSNRKIISDLINSSDELVAINSITNTLVVYPKKNINIWNALLEKEILTLNLENVPGITDLNSIRLTIHSQKTHFDCLLKAIECLV